MEILIDTNVLLDWLLDREPFVRQADQIMRCCITGMVKGHLASHSILNIFYITRRAFDIEKRKEILLMLCEKFNVIGLGRQMIVESLHNENWNDLEDGLQMSCAVTEGVDYIITRDSEGFEFSKVQALSPGAFLKMFEAETGEPAKVAPIDE